MIRTPTPYFNHVIVAIQESDTLETIKMKDLIRSLETHELRILERKGVRESVRAL